MPAPGELQNKETYCRKQWKRVQHVANEFWSIWRRYFMQPCKFFINETKL